MVMPLPLTRWCPGLLALVGLVSCSGDDVHPLQGVADGKAQVTGNGVLVIVIDGLRWDHTSLAGYERKTTPFLRRFAATGLVFTDAWASTASLLGSHIAILLGCDPSIAQPPKAQLPVIPSLEAGIRIDQADSGPEAWFIPEGLQLLSQPFLGSGWRTAAFVDHPMIAELRGFDRGFMDFIAFGGRPDVEEREIGVFGVGRRFVKWLNRLPIDQDWFAYVHMNDLERVWTEGPEPEVKTLIERASAKWTARPELGRVPPLGYTEPILDALPPSRAAAGEPLSLAEYELRYDRGLRAMDASLQRLIAHADEFGRKERITVVIVGSFGMGLGENGLYLQAGLVEEEDLHVPLVIRPSKALRDALGWVTEEPRRSDSLVSLTDLAPTLVDLYGLRAPGEMIGVSLRPICVDPARQVRSQAFVSGAVTPAGGVVTSALRYARYGVEGRLMARQEGARNPERATETALAGLLDRWETLLLEQRRWLHFGDGEADKRSVDHLRALQITPLGRPEGHAEPSPRAHSDAPGG